MSNKVALFLVVLILGGLLLDYLANDLQASLFLARKWYNLIEWMAFWR